MWVIIHRKYIIWLKEDEDLTTESNKLSIKQTIGYNSLQINLSTDIKTLHIELAYELHPVEFDAPDDNTMQES